MSAPGANINPAASSLPDGAKTESKPVPFALIGLGIVLFYLGFVGLDYFGALFNPQVYYPYTSYADVDGEQFRDPDTELRLKGQQIFNLNCSPCHQASGSGVAGQFPPLAGSEWVNAKSPTRIIRGVLCGLGGPITVKGQAYNNNMVPWKDALKDEDIAAVLTFVRSEKDWGNDAPAVKPEDVAAIRARFRPIPKPSPRTNF